MWHKTGIFTLFDTTFLMKDASEHSVLVGSYFTFFKKSIKRALKTLHKFGTVLRMCLNNDLDQRNCHYNRLVAV